MSDWDSDCGNDSTLPAPAPAPAKSTSSEWRRGGRRRFHRHREGAHHKIIHIPTSKVGLVIGKGGVKISDIQYESDTVVKIDGSSNGTTKVKIIGSDSAIARAELLILDIVTEKEKKDNTKDLYKHVDLAKANASAVRNQKPCADIMKCFYVEDPSVTSMSSTYVSSWRRRNNITVSQQGQELLNNDIITPVQTFEQAFRNHPEILNGLYKQGFQNPSPIQSQAWPILLSGLDMVSIAETGSGKTLAYLLPAFIHIEGQPTPREERPGPSVLILAPTRELVLQIHEEVNKFQYNGIKSVCIYGGVDKREQIDILSEGGVDIIIATPGRLKDLIMSDHINAMHFSYVVFDEADRMASLGFAPQINVALFDIRPTIQCVMTSATWPSTVQYIAEKFMHDPIHVNVGSLDLATVHTVCQQVKIIEEDDKNEFIFDFVNKRSPDDKILIFCGRKAVASHIFVSLICKNIPCEALHSDLDQSDRESAFEAIRTGTISILVATDVAARGLDIQGLTHVINRDFPMEMEDYVHRIGRTGRAGKSGIALSLLTKNDARHASKLIALFEEANQEVPCELWSLADDFKNKKPQRQSRCGKSRRAGPLLEDFIF